MDDFFKLVGIRSLIYFSILNKMLYFMWISFSVNSCFLVFYKSSLFSNSVFSKTNKVSKVSLSFYTKIDNIRFLMQVFEASITLHECKKAILRFKGKYSPVFECFFVFIELNKMKFKVSFISIFSFFSKWDPLCSKI